MTQTVDSVCALVQRIHILQAEQSHGQRLIIAIVGAPGAGKSTLAAEVCSLLNESASADSHPGGVNQPSGTTAGATCSHGQGQAHAGNSNRQEPLERAVVVPMDGFHLDNDILESRKQMAVKGSPQTFDVDGLVVLIHRLATTDSRPVYIPVFDRAADLSRNAAQCVNEQHSVIIVEGNYLLLSRAGWQSLAPLFHLSIMLDVPLETLEARLIQRWIDHGLDAEAARRRALSNDIPNARLVLQESQKAHLYFKSVRQ